MDFELFWDEDHARKVRRQRDDAINIKRNLHHQYCLEVRPFSQVSKEVIQAIAEQLILIG